jgi:hypothetical protein
MESKKDLLASKTTWGFLALLDPVALETVLLPFVTAIVVFLKGVGLDLGDPAAWTTALKNLIAGVLFFWGQASRTKAIGSVAGVPLPGK